jgi:UPF0755 protein
VALSPGSKWFMAVGLLVVAAGAAGIWWLDNNVFVPDVEPGQEVEYEVSRGQTVRAVGEDLAELGVVRSAVRFRLAAEDAGLAQVLQPGTFEFLTGMTNEEAIEVLAAGPLAPPTVRFTVQEGLTVAQTLERLADQFVDHSVSDFRDVLDARIEAGENGAGVLQLPDWVPEPADMVADDIEPFEGLLFPETYDVADDAGPQAILQRMIDQLTTTVNNLPDDLLARVDTRPYPRATDEEDGEDDGEAADDPADDDADADAEADGDAEAAEELEGLGGRRLYDALIVASLIERETRVDDERGVIAGVIENRLADGMRLQIDATVVYAMGGGPTAIVLLEDLEVDHPANTYQIDGLPPTPIAGAGAASFRAALDPADVPYFFYVLDVACDGSHVFAETGDEHDTNVAAFRDAGRCQEELGE